MSDLKQHTKSEDPTEAELKRLQLEEAKLRLQDLQGQVDERQLRNEEKQLKRKMNGASLKASERDNQMKQRACNHQKGGIGMQGLEGQGDNAADYALARSQMLNGDIWQRCLRCGKTWAPPVKSECVDKDGKFSQTIFDAKLVEYRAGLTLPTKNTTAGSTLAHFSDGGEILREALKDSNLR